MSKTEIPVPKRAAGCGLSYRAATQDDQGILAEIYTSTRAEEVAATGWPDEQQREFLQMQFTAQHEHYKKHYQDAVWLIIEHGGQAAGRLYLEDWTKELRIIDIALLPQHRGKGYGEAILKDLMERAAGTFRRVSIHVEKNNPAMTLYQRLGFKMIEDKGVYDLLEWQP